MKIGAGLFYLAMGIVAWLLASFLHIFPWRMGIPKEGPFWGKVVFAGLGIGLGLVVTSRMLDKFSPFQRLNTLLARYLLPLSFSDIVFLSFLSAWAEELLFRGVLMQWTGIHLSSFLFGFLHYGGRRSFLLWGVVAWIVGYILGGAFCLSGSLLTPMLAHFTVNYFNLLRLRRYKTGAS